MTGKPKETRKRRRKNANLLSLVPDCDISEEFLGAGGEGHRKVEAKDPVHVLEEIDGALDLRVDLVGRAEDVGVILLEPAHTGESSEGTAQLIAVEHSEIGHPQRKLAVRAVHNKKEMQKEKQVLINKVTRRIEFQKRKIQTECGAQTSHSAQGSSWA